MRPRLPELEKKRLKSQEASERYTRGLERYEGYILVYFIIMTLPYILGVICSTVISCNYNNLLISYFGIKNIRKLVTMEYIYPILYQDVKAYMNSFNICLASKVVCH